MKLKTKAYYNLLFFKSQQNQALKVEPWEIEDLREVSTEELFSRLAALHVSLDEEQFLIYCENYDSPEQLTAFFDLAKPEHDQASLLIFELWRRLAPEKQSLSLFCDELDHRIEEYNADPGRFADGMEHLVARLEEVLEESCSAGEDPKTVFRELTTYVAHNLESFLYDYILTQIEIGDDVYAAELIEDFLPYIADPFWLLLLKAQVVSKSNMHQANLIIRQILDHSKENPDLDLLLETASFLVGHGDPHLFLESIRLAFAQLRTEEDFQELLAIVSDYYRCLDREKEQKEIEVLFSKRLHLPLEAPVDPSDEAITHFQRFLDHPSWAMQ